MGTLPDWMIQGLCESWSSSWRPGGAPAAEPGEPLPVPDPGPLVEPFDAALLGPSSLDMRLGRIFESGERMEAHCLRGGIRIGLPPAQRLQVGGALPGSWRVEPPADGLDVEIVLAPGQTVICVSAEYYRLPPDIIGELYTKSSAARADINHSTASLIHPGFHGSVAFELVNLGPIPRPIRSGSRLVQIKFSRMEAAARVPYFAQPGAKYRGQTDRISTADAEGKT